MQFNHRLAGDRRERSGHANVNALTVFHASLLEVLPHAAVYLGPDGLLLGHNKRMEAACAAHGLGEVPGRLRDFLSAASLKRCEPVLSAALGGVPAQASGGLSLKSGAGFCRQLICTSFPAVSGGGRVVLVQFVSMDNSGPAVPVGQSGLAPLSEAGGAADFLRYFPDDVLIFSEAESPDDKAGRLLELIDTDFEKELLIAALADQDDLPRSLYVPERAENGGSGTAADQSVCEVRLIPIPDLTAGGAPQAVMAILRRNVESPDEIAENRRLAYQDPLTGLENRRSFTRTLTQDLALLSRQAGEGLAVFYIDLDEFKKVNDLGGHEAGDDMLLHVAACLRQTLGDRGTAARIGGDEFAGTVFTGSEEAALRIAEDILEGFDRIHLETGNRVFTIGGSIGVAFVGASLDLNKLDASQLIGLADQACLRGKRFGGRSVQVHTVQPGDCTRSGSVATDLPEPDSFRGNELALYAMPIFDLRKNSLFGYEMLLRLQGDRAQGLSSRAWISAAERSGFIARVDAWTLHRVLDAADRNPVRKTLTMNVSADSARDPGFRECLVNRLSVNPLQASRLCLEVAEKDFLREPALVETFFRFASELGCQTAIDDFAGHWPSLSRLTGLRVEWLKLQAGLTQHVARSPEKAAILSGLVKAVQALGLKVVAKHVETAEDAALLKELDIEAAQGFYFGKPKPWSAAGLT